MPLQPDIAAIIANIPKSTPPSELGHVALRARVNAAMAAVPTYDVPLASVEDGEIPAAGADAPALKTRIYTPKGEGPFPLIVYYHGGGFVIGDLNVSDAICRGLASGTGAKLISIDYRLAPENPWPTPQDDGWRALNWVVDNAKALGGEPANVSVAGDSAGANMSAAMTLRARDAGLKLRAQMLLYPSPGFDDSLPSFAEWDQAPLMTGDDIKFYWSRYCSDPAGRQNQDCAPLVAKDHSGLPPAFVSTAEMDPSRDLGEVYADKLRAAGNDIYFKRYDGQPHGFYAWVAYAPSVKAAMKDLTDWASAHLGTAVTA